MTAEEADALAADLERASVYVEAVEPPAYYDGQDEWQIRAWCPDPTLAGTSYDTNRERTVTFRSQTVMWL